MMFFCLAYFVAKKGEESGIFILSICLYVCIYFVAILYCTYVCLCLYYVVAFILQLFQVCVDVVMYVTTS